MKMIVMLLHVAAYFSEIINFRYILHFIKMSVLWHDLVFVSTVKFSCWHPINLKKNLAYIFHSSHTV